MTDFIINFVAAGAVAFVAFLIVLWRVFPRLAKKDTEGIGSAIGATVIAGLVAIAVFAWFMWSAYS